MRHCETDDKNVDLIAGCILSYCLFLITGNVFERYSTSLY